MNNCPIYCRHIRFISSSSCNENMLESCYQRSFISFISSSEKRKKKTRMQFSMHRALLFSLPIFISFSFYSFSCNHIFTVQSFFCKHSSVDRLYTCNYFLSCLNETLQMYVIVFLVLSFHFLFFLFLLLSVNSEIKQLNKGQERIEFSMAQEKEMIITFSLLFIFFFVLQRNVHFN